MGLKKGNILARAVDWRHVSGNSSLRNFNDSKELKISDSEIESE